MTKAFEQKLLVMISRDIRRIFANEDTITKNYCDCYNYLNEMIDIVRDIASQWLLTELYNLTDDYQYKYLFNKGLI